MPADLGIIELLLLASSKVDLVFSLREFVLSLLRFFPCSYFLWNNKLLGFSALVQKMGAVLHFDAAVAEAALVATLANMRQKRRLDTGCQHRVVVCWN